MITAVVGYPLPVGAESRQNITTGIVQKGLQRPLTTAAPIRNTTARGRTITRLGTTAAVITAHLTAVQLLLTRHQEAVAQAPEREQVQVQAAAEEAGTNH